MTFIIFNFESPKEFKMQDNIMFQRVTFSGDMMKISLSEICIRFSPVLWISSAQPKCVDHVEGNYTYKTTTKYTNQVNIICI